MVGVSLALDELGVDAGEVEAELAALCEADVAPHSGRVLGGVFDADAGLREFATGIYTRFLPHNLLYVNLYPSLGKMERGVVSSVAHLLGGGPEVTGNFTSGGTESIMLAVKAAREHAREHRPEIARPKLVLPITAHPAFHKAAHYLGLDVITTAVDPQEFRADLGALASAIDESTILVVGSAPNFSHGTIDPIPEMAALAAERGALFHVDACVGGLYLPFLRECGYAVPDFDFSIPGVTSMSADLHKYGYVPKNASVVLYANRELRSHSLFVCSGTTEYAVINPTVQSTRSAGPLAAAWAMFRRLGREGYIELVVEAQLATTLMVESAREIEGLEVLGTPAMSMFTLASERFNIFELADEMSARGWSLVPQFAVGGSPRNLHVAVTASSAARADEFGRDLADACAVLRERPPSVDEDAIREAIATHARSPLPNLMAALMPLAGLTGPQLPSHMAALNTVLDHLEVPVRDALLRSYINLTT